jgi:hypothetical protein
MKVNYNLTNIQNEVKQREETLNKTKEEIEYNKQSITKN